MKRYGYHRTSTREQHLDRGITEITAYCEQNQLELERIFTDQQTGKNFNRPRYQVLKEDVLRSGDELIITEVDRLGRNKRDAINQYVSQQYGKYGYLRAERLLLKRDKRILVPKSMEKTVWFVYNPCQVLQGLLLCHEAKQIILQGVNCLILKE